MEGIGEAVKAFYQIGCALIVGLAVLLALALLASFIGWPKVLSLWPVFVLVGVSVGAGICIGRKP